MADKVETNMEQAILETAEMLFLEKGFAMTSTTEIAKHVGCNQALVHYYYRTKERLFEAVFETKARLFVSTFLKANDPGLTFEERLRKRVEAHFDLLVANPKLPFLIFNEVNTNPKRLETFKSKIRDLPKAVLLHFHHDLDEEIKKGHIRPITVLDLILTIVSLNVSLFLLNPIIKTIAGMTDVAYLQFLEHRRQENVEIVLRSLRP
jgi:AcrR family transcriptional regulator